MALAGLAGPVVITTEAAAEAAAGGGGGGGGGATDSVSIFPSFHLPALQHYHKSLSKKNEGKLRSSKQRNDGKSLTSFRV